MGRSRPILLLLLPVVAVLSPLLHACLSLKLPLGLHFWLLAGLVVLFGLLLGIALFWLGSRRPGRLRQILQAGLLGALVILVFDLLTYRAEQPLLQAFPLAALGLWAGLALAFWIIRRQVARILFIGALALLTSTLAPHVTALLPPSQHPASRIESAATDAPVIYIVLDEMIGPEAIPRDIEGSEAVYRAVRQLFDAHGFRLYGRAFSRHALTVRSIPNTLNFDLDDVGRGMILQHASNDVVQSALLDQLAARRPLAIYQTRHIDFCSAAATRCETLPSYDATSDWVSYLGFGPAENLIVLAEAVSGSVVARAGTRLVAALLTLDSDKTVPEYFDVHAFPAWFDHVSADVAGSAGQWNYFIHLLSPHAPYLLDAHCIPRAGWDLPYNLTEEKRLVGADLEAARDRHYRAYFEQMTCLIGKLDVFLTRLDQTPALKDATIVLHGDHGSRISGGRFAETVTERDLIDNHAALYAIRAPGIGPGYDLREVSIQALTAEYFGGRVPPLGSSDDRSIVIDVGATGDIQVRQMPDLPGGDGRTN